MSPTMKFPGRRRYRSLPAVLLLGMLLGACGDGPDSPEQQIRHWLARAETAAENGDFTHLKELIASDYVDSRGHDRRAALNLLRLYLLGNRSVYLLTRIKAISLTGEELAHVRLAVAMAGAPIPDSLSGVRAEMKLFDLALRGSDDSWQILQADWKPAAPGDFL